MSTQRYASSLTRERPSWPLFCSFFSLKHDPELPRPDLVCKLVSRAQLSQTQLRLDNERKERKKEKKEEGRGKNGGS